jgi:hypothetical protein
MLKQIKINSIIISPSGNLYGSENVLLDFLQNTDYKYLVFVKNKGLLFNQIIKIKKHVVKSFITEKNLYVKLFLFLFFDRNINNIYVNEGGHIKYIKLLAKFFKKRKFIVHLRILEDCNEKRIGRIPKNIRLITISEFMLSSINKKYKCEVIYDPYTISQQNTNIFKTPTEFLKIGLIGRVTKTKELDNLLPVLDYLSVNSKKKIKFIFFGDYIEKDLWFIDFKTKISVYSDFEFSFLGFVNGKTEIYKQVDIVLHLNTVEALGRIVFEAIDYLVPIFTFDKGGSGELMLKLGLNDFIIKKEDKWTEVFAKKIIEFNFERSFIEQIIEAKNIISEEYHPEKYTKQIENLF